MRCARPCSLLAHRRPAHAPAVRGIELVLGAIDVLDLAMHGKVAPAGREQRDGTGGSAGPGLVEAHLDLRPGGWEERHHSVSGRPVGYTLVDVGEDQHPP